MSKVPWSLIGSFDNVEDSWDTIFEVANVHAPPISVRQKADEREREIEYIN